MKLTKFSITNYRSITKAYKITISDFTVLVGKNNEGKSNILRALNVAMKMLEKYAQKYKYNSRYMPRDYYLRHEDLYFWERDFPIELQSRTQSTNSIFHLEFELTSEENEEFNGEIGSDLNGLLPIIIKCGENDYSVGILKPGKGSRVFNKKSIEISQFIIERIYFNYIPAVRTDREAIDIIRGMVSDELKILETEPEYIQALAKITELQQPIMSNLAVRIKEPLIKFLPGIKDVTIGISEDLRMSSLRRDVEVVIDDGSRTGIEYKGDGIKSLVTLALLKEKYGSNSSSIIAIEEPESHLHPSAMHELKRILNDISYSSQVLISTHNPLFIDRENISSNIIINQHTAKPAKKIKDIRELLGIQASDNLINADFVLVVEGVSDKRILRSLLPLQSSILSKVLTNNYMMIDEIGGANKLSYKLSLLSDMLCRFHVFLDDDDSGRKSFEEAKARGYLDEKICTFTICLGMNDAELEDLINPEVYLDSLKVEFAVDLKINKNVSGKKWSERAKNSFLCHGKKWDKEIEERVKTKVADCVCENPENALNPNRAEIITALVATLEKRL